MYDVGVMGNGALAGLVAITSGTSTVYPWGAIIIGLIAGALYVFASRVSIWLKVRQPSCMVFSAHGRAHPLRVCKLPPLLFRSPVARRGHSEL